MRHTVLALTAALCLTAALAVPLEAVIPAAQDAVPTTEQRGAAKTAAAAIETVQQEAAAAEDMLPQGLIKTAIENVQPEERRGLGLAQLGAVGQGVETAAHEFNNMNQVVEAAPQRGLLGVFDHGATAVRTGVLSGQHPQTVQHSLVQPQVVPQTQIQPEVVHRQPQIVQQQPQIVQQQPQIVQQQPQIVQQQPQIVHQQPQIVHQQPQILQQQPQIVQQPGFQPAYHPELVRQPVLQPQIIPQSGIPNQLVQQPALQRYTFQPEVSPQVPQSQTDVHPGAHLALLYPRTQRGLFDVLDLGTTAIGTAVLSGINSFGDVIGRGIDRRPQTVQPVPQYRPEIAQPALQAQSLQQLGSQPQYFPQFQPQPAPQSAIQSQITPGSGYPYETTQQPGFQPNAVQQFTTFQPQMVSQPEVQSQIPQVQPQMPQSQLEAHPEAPGQIGDPRTQRGLLDMFNLGANGVGTGVLGGSQSFNTVLGDGLNHPEIAQTQQTSFQSQSFQQPGSQPQYFQQSTIQTQTPENGFHYEMVQQQQPGHHPSTVEQFTTFQPEMVQHPEVHQVPLAHTDAQPEMVQHPEVHQIPLAHTDAQPEMVQHPEVHQIPQAQTDAQPEVAQHSEAHPEVPQDQPEAHPEAARDQPAVDAARRDLDLGSVKGLDKNSAAAPLNVKAEAAEAAVKNVQPAEKSEEAVKV